MNEDAHDGARDARLAEAVALREGEEREEARTRLLDLAARHPDDAEVAYQTAWVHDTLGLEAEAVPFYERALDTRAAPALAPEHRRGALLGLGSTYRVLGRYEEAVATLRLGTEEFPDDGALRTFLAMALFNTGRHHESAQLLLRLVADTSEDPYVRRYRKAVAYYAEDLNATV